MIDVIIPAYNAHKTIRDTLLSLSYQDISDKIIVYLIDDNSDESYDQLLEFFLNFLDIKLIKLEKNVGPGIARNIGLRRSCSPYVMFIDSDDLLYDSYSVSMLYNNIESYDVIISDFKEEVDDDFLVHHHDTIWLHGKMYKRDFLDKYNISFNDSRMNEDNGFNQLILLCGARVKYVDYCTYIWCNNMNSVTRVNNHEKLYDLVLGYIYNVCWALKGAIDRNCNQIKIGKLAFSSLITIYSYYLKFVKDEILVLSKDIKDIFVKYKITDSEKDELLISQYKYLLDIGNKELLNPCITFDEFLRRIK